MLKFIFNSLFNAYKLIDIKQSLNIELEIISSNLLINKYIEYYIIVRLYII